MENRIFYNLVNECLISVVIMIITVLLGIFAGLDFIWKWHHYSLRCFTYIFYRSPEIQIFIWHILRAIEMVENSFFEIQSLYCAYSNIIWIWTMTSIFNDQYCCAWCRLEKELNNESKHFMFFNYSWSVILPKMSQSLRFWSNFLVCLLSTEPIVFLLHTEWIIYTRSNIFKWNKKY